MSMKTPAISMTRTTVNMRDLYKAYAAADLYYYIEKD